MKSPRNPPAAANRNQLRIIAGKWRSRRLAFPDVNGLRPTGDRIRETLFNWIGPQIAGSRCLDAFAGSGALGFEALSRGADEVVMIENNLTALRQLEASKQLLDATGATLLGGSAIAWLESGVEKRTFDIVFLDPPFDGNLLDKALYLITANNLVSLDGLAYVESAANKPLAIPQGWSIHKEKTTGGITCRLLVRA